MSSLDRLNASERELLLLLGQGHTAKSIASLKGLSELAVNERFRSARRKTGIGSSREIARLLAAQENRDDFIGLAEPVAPPTPLPRQDAPRGASFLRRWRFPMAAAAALFAAALLAQQTSAPPVQPTTDPLPSPSLEAVFSNRAPSPDLDDLHAEVTAGQPDPLWSAETEAGLSRIYRELPGFSADIVAFKATCNASLCEVVAIGRPGLSGAGIVPLMEGLQGRALRQSASSLKLDPIVQSFGGANNDPSTAVFISYWRRQT